MSAKHKFAEVRCGGHTKKDMECTNYLGHVQTDVDNTAYFHCSRCNRTKEVAVEDGIISEKVLLPGHLVFNAELPLRLAGA